MKSAGKDYGRTIPEERCKELTEVDEVCAHEKDDCLVTDIALPVRLRRRFTDRLRTDANLRHKLLHTGCVCLAMVALGWRLSMSGPALPDLRLIIDENLSRASWILSAIAFGGLAGSLCSGALYDRFNKYLVFIGLALALAGATVFTPRCTSFASMVAIHALVGVFGAGLDTISTADTVCVWKSGSAPFLQAVNFGFSIGAMLSPLSVEPFLAKRHVISHSPETNDTLVMNTSSSPLSFNLMHTISHAENISNNTSAIDSGLFEYGDTAIHYAFIIAGAVCLLASLAFMIEYGFLGTVYTISETPNAHRDSKSQLEDRYPLRKCWRVVLFLLLSVMLATYVISERTFYSYLMTYLVEHLNWDKSAGSNATTLFWIVFSVGRCLSIAIVKVLRMSLVFAVFFGILLLGEVLLLVSVKFDIPALIWISCGLFGLGFAPLYSNIFSWLATNVCLLTGKITSVSNLIVATGAIIFPLITGNIMSTISYDWFIYLEMILTCSMILQIVVAEIILHVLTR